MKTGTAKANNLSLIIADRLDQSAASLRCIDLMTRLAKLGESLGCKWELNDSTLSLPRHGGKKGLVLTISAVFRLILREDGESIFLVENEVLKKQASQLGPERAEMILAKLVHRGQDHNTGGPENFRGSDYMLSLSEKEFSSWDQDMMSVIENAINATFKQQKRSPGDGSASNSPFQLEDIVGAAKLLRNGVIESTIRDIFPDEISIPFDQLREGAAKQVTINAYERSPQARRKCIRHHGLTCKVCEMDFESRYGEMGRGFIHVHHKTPLSKAMGERAVDPETDLVPVCPNCHAMLHAENPPLSVDDLKLIVQRHTNR